MTNKKKKIEKNMSYSKMINASCFIDWGFLTQIKKDEFKVMTNGMSLGQPST